MKEGGDPRNRAGQVHHFRRHFRFIGPRSVILPEPPTRLQARTIPVQPVSAQHQPLSPRTPGRRSVATSATPCRRWWHTKQLTPLEDRCEQLPWHRLLRHPKSRALGMPDHLCSDLDQRFPQRGYRPVLHGPRQRQPTQEVPEVVRRCEWLESRLVVPAVPARQPRPLPGILTLLDPLLCRAVGPPSAEPARISSAGRHAHFARRGTGKRDLH